MWNNLYEWNFKITWRNLIVVWNLKCCHRFNFQGNFCCRKWNIWIFWLNVFFAMLTEFLLCFSYAEDWRNKIEKVIKKKKKDEFKKKSEREKVSVGNCSLLAGFIYTTEWLKFKIFFSFSRFMPCFIHNLISEICS